MTGCFQFKAQITFSLQNNPRFTLKSEKVIWIREIQCTAETHPLALALQAARGSWRFTGQSRRKELPFFSPEVMYLLHRQHLAIRKVEVNAFQVWKVFTLLPFARTIIILSELLAGNE